MSSGKYAIIMVVLLLIPLVGVYAKPTWLKKGTYAKYSGGGTMSKQFTFEGVSISMTYTLETSSKYVVTNITDNRARFNQTYSTFMNMTTVVTGTPPTTITLNESGTNEFVVDTETREIVEGPAGYTGYTSLWIPTNVSVGDTVKIENYTAEITSVDEEYSTKCDKYKKRTAIVAQYEITVSYEVVFVTKFFYDRKLGFLLGIEMYYKDGSGKIEITLTDTNISAGISPLIIITVGVVAAAVIIVVVMKVVLKKRAS